MPLSKDILWTTFHQLEYGDIIKCKFICKEWKKIIDTEENKSGENYLPFGIKFDVYGEKLSSNLGGLNHLSTWTSFERAYNDIKRQLKPLSYSNDCFYIYASKINKICRSKKKLHITMKKYSTNWQSYYTTCETSNIAQGRYYLQFTTH